MTFLTRNDFLDLLSELYCPTPPDHFYHEAWDQYVILIF
jgi:hypothetical protein